MMDNNYLKRYSIQNMGIHGKLIIIQSLLVIIPFLVLFYAFYHHRVFLNTHQLALIAFIFLMVLGGLHILRQMFERIISLASSVKHAGAQDGEYTDVQSGTDELKDLSNSLHRVLNRLEKTTEDLRRRSFELLTIRESMEAARNSLDTYHIMDMILAKAMGLTEARVGSILIAESSTEQFRVAAIRGSSEVMKKGMCIPMQTSLSRQVLLKKKPLLVTDIQQDHRTERPNQSRYESPSFLSMPILIGNEVSAVLNLADKENGLIFNQEDEELSAILLREISFALENAQLHGRIKDQLEEIRGKNLQLEKEVTERQRIEDELKKYQGNLKQLVEEQTSEINRTNIQLQQEIKDRSAAEEALRESEKRYREFVELLPHMVFETDPRWKLTFYNRAVLTHTGYGEEDIRQGLTFLEMVVPEERERVAAIFKRRLQNEFVAGVEYNLMRKDGSIFPVMIYASPLITNDEAWGLRGVIFDLNDRKRLEQQLLPASNKDAVLETQEAQQILKGTETILLVDDERTVLEVNNEILASLGYNVIVAGNGHDALALYLENIESIQLVILDLIMPGMSGGETFDRLKQVNSEIIVLLSSGHGMNQQVQQILDRGCRGFIQKPFNISHLSKKIREVFNK